MIFGQTHAQSGDIQFEYLMLENGLSQSTIHTIFQDSQGFMWFGTEDGLNQYNGYEFTVYKNDIDNPNSLSDSDVWAIYEDKAQNLWLGTAGGGLNQYIRKEGKFIHYQHKSDDSNSLSDNDITRFC